MTIIASVSSGHTFDEPSDNVDTPSLNNMLEGASVSIPTPFALGDGGTGANTAQGSAKALEVASRLAEWIEFNTAGAPPEVTLGTFPASSFAAIVQIFVSEAFDAGTLNDIRIGTAADTDAISTLEDVSSVGLLEPTRGIIIYSASALTLIAQYVQTGTAATAGKALCVVTFLQVPTQP